jgi:hypothetical protein
MRTLTCLLLALGIATAPAVVSAANPKTKYTKKQVLIFGDDEVRAGVEGPDGILIQEVRRPKSSSLITIREHFIPELIKSAESF